MLQCANSSVTLAVMYVQTIKLRGKTSKTIPTLQIDIHANCIGWYCTGSLKQGQTRI